MSPLVWRAACIAPSKVSPVNGFCRKSIAPAFTAWARVGGSSRAVMKIIGIRNWLLPSRHCSSKPVMTGIWTSTIKQLVLTRTSEPSKSSADEKIAAAKPTECKKPLRASRTDSSSSTTVTRMLVEMSSDTALCFLFGERSQIITFRIKPAHDFAAQRGGGSHPSSFTVPPSLSLRNHVESDDSGRASARGLDPLQAGLRRTDHNSRGCRPRLGPSELDDPQLGFSHVSQETSGDSNFPE